jgi:hypothetical protein
MVISINNSIYYLDYLVLSTHTLNLPQGKSNVGREGVISCPGC